MTPSEYQAQDAIGLAGMIRDGDVTASEVLACAIAAIEDGNPALHAVIHPLFDIAKGAVARELPQGPLAGVPFLLKDTGVAVAGTPMTNGSRLFRDNVSPRDSTHAARLRRAGLVIMGKTNMPELGLSFTTEPQAFGATRNPWDIGRSPGGSSGGSAAAVAAGMVPMAHASDGAGSIRLPAAHCGLFGFKPSRGRNPFGPELGEAMAGLSAVHCVSRTVRDSAALLDATSGPEAGDPYMIAPPQRPFFAEIDGDPPRLRIALSTHSPIGTPVDPQCVGAAKEAALLCERLGHIVEIAEPDYDANAIKSAWRAVATVTAATSVADYVKRVGISDPLSLLEPINAAWVSQAPSISGADYADAIALMRRAGRALGGFFERYDIFLTPTAAELPPPLGAMACRNADVDAFYDQFWRHGPFTAVFNTTGSPAMTVPLGQSREGLPIGVHFAAALGDDSKLFALAGQLERAAPWAGRRPPLRSH